MSNMLRATRRNVLRRMGYKTNLSRTECSLVREGYMARYGSNRPACECVICKPRRKKDGPLQKVLDNQVVYSVRE